MSPFLTGPFTFLTKLLDGLLTNTTFTCVIPPLEPMDKDTGLEGRDGAGRESRAGLTSFADDLLH